MEYPNHFHFRLTSDLSACQVIEKILLALKEPVKGVPTIGAVLTSHEIGKKSKQEHTHSAIYTNISKSTLSKRLKKQFTMKGNQQFSLSVEQNPETHFSYIIKEGDFVWSQNFEEIIPISQIPKWIEPKSDFKKQLKELDKRYMDDDMDDGSYLDNLLRIYALPDAPAHLMLHLLRSHWLALFNRRNRLSVRRRTTFTGYEEEQYYPRQVLVSQIKNFIDNKY